LSEKDLTLIPYTSKSKLIFKSNLADSMVYTVDTITKNVFSNGFPIMDPSECSTTYDYEDYDIKFKGTTTSESIQLGLLHIPDLTFILSMSFAPNDSIVNFNAASSIINDSIPGNYYQTLQIGLKTFLYVHELTSMSKKNSSSHSIQFVYYTTKQGIVGFKSNDGRTWYLAN
jgi:hypothetical protein